MIPVGEIRALQAEWRLRDDVIEKDYVLGWVLAGIAAEPALRPTWIFKGGTALRKCYYETYRLSEDLDFTVIDGGPETPEALTPIFQRVSAWLQDRCGLELVVDDASFRRRQNRRGKPTTEGRLSYRGPRQPPQLPKLKLDITSDEVVTSPPVDREVSHPYSDAPQPLTAVRAYSMPDLMAEKLRALAERCRPRDLYDVVSIYRHPERPGPEEILPCLSKKCAFVGIGVPDRASIEATPFRAEVEGEWKSMLAHQLPHLPPFAEFWSTLEGLFAWLRAPAVPVAPLRRAQYGNNLNPTWAPPRGMTTWGVAAPLELIRFAGANHLKVMIDYRAEDGRRGPRTVEPYSLRRTKEGDLLLFVVNDRRQLRSYRIDRIAGAEVTSEAFVPHYLVEF